MAMKMQSCKDFGVMTLSSWGHVTTTWLRLSCDYWTQRGHFPVGGQWWPCTYLALLWRYKASKLHLAHVKGQKFTAHARCHVTCRQGVQNDHIFGIPEAILSIYYTTFMSLRWWLRAIYRWNLIQKHFRQKFLSLLFAPIFNFGVIV